MRDITAKQREEYAKALRDLCRSRGITSSGPALAAFLRAKGCSIHANTAKAHLRGERTPRAATLEQLLTAFTASNDERAILLSCFPRAADPHIVSLRDALAPSAGRGRKSQRAHWRYEIGRTDDKDRCWEERYTVVGSEGLQSVSFATGQLGKLGFDLLDLSRLAFSVKAWRIPLEPTVLEDRIPAAVQVLELEPAANKYRLVVRFAEVIRNETVRWVVSYRWPGLWRSLREHGVGDGSLRIDRDDEVQAASVTLVAPEDEFGDLRLIRHGEERGTVGRATKGNQVSIRWAVDRPMTPLRFEVRSDRHARP